MHLEQRLVGFIPSMGTFEIGNEGQYLSPVNMLFHDFRGCAHVPSVIPTPFPKLAGFQWTSDVFVFACSSNRGLMQPGPDPELHLWHSAGTERPFSELKPPPGSALPCMDARSTSPVMSAH